MEPFTTPEKGVFFMPNYSFLLTIVMTSIYLEVSAVQNGINPFSSKVSLRFQKTTRSIAALEFPIMLQS
jgi:hypothetical protein